MINKLISEIEKNKGNEKQIENVKRFFKCGKGTYGEGDIFYGITVPVLRKISKKYLDLKLKDIQVLLNNKVHEFRLVGFYILNYKFDKTKNQIEKKEIYELTLKNLKKANNWDLVDMGSGQILGKYLLDKSDNERKILYELLKSNNLWERRVSIVSTLKFVMINKQVKDCIKISKLLLKDKQDLIHKAVGWVLREVGKKEIVILKDFLIENIKIMSRTTLRYSIEKFDKKERKKFLKL